MRAALERAAVLAARHHLLARVAALLEIDAADQFQVHHLRHELLRPWRPTRAARRCAPPASARLSGSSAGSGGRLAAGPQPARHRGAVDDGVGQADQVGAAGVGAAPRGAGRASPSAAPAASPARPHSGSSALASLSLHLARSTNIDSRFSVAGSRSALQASSTSSSPRRPDHETGQQPALGRAVAGQPRLAGVPGAAMSCVSWPCRKLRGVGAAGADHAPVGQAHGAVGQGWSGRCDSHALIMISRHVWSRPRGFGWLAGACWGCCCVAGRAGGRPRAWWWLDRPLPLAGATVPSCRSSPARTPREVAQAWVDAGVQTSPRLLYEWFRWSGQARRIRAGSYEIEPGTTPRRLLAKMVQGDETLEQRALHRRLDAAPAARRAGARAAPASPPPPA